MMGLAELLMRQRRFADARSIVEELRRSAPDQARELAGWLGMSTEYW
jgi:hypothetical protein